MPFDHVDGRYIVYALMVILIYTVHPLVLFPASFITPFVGILFGPIAGSIIAYLGAMSSATTSFFLARNVNNLYFAENKNRMIQKITLDLDKKGFIVSLLLHIGPIVPFDLINYCAGISKIRFKTYIAATSLGIIPGVIVSVFLGSSILEPRFLIPAILIIICILFLGKYIDYNKFRKL